MDIGVERFINFSTQQMLERFTLGCLIMMYFIFFYVSVVTDVPSSITLVLNRTTLKLKRNIRNLKRVIFDLGYFTKEH